MKSCTTNNCDNPVWSKGKCWYHRDIKPIAYKPKTRKKKKPEKRFGEKIIKLPELDIWYSRYRKVQISSDGWISCFICDKPVQTIESELMHYFGRGSLCYRYHDVNTQVGCFECNQIKDGNLKQYKVKLVEKYGQETIDLLIQNSKKLCNLPQPQRQKFLKKWKIFVKKNPIRSS